MPKNKVDNGDLEKISDYLTLCEHLLNNRHVRMRREEENKSYGF